MKPAAPLVKTQPSRTITPELVDAIAECDARGWEGGQSLADTDFECEHGRLPGDVCPSPLVTYQSRPGPAVQSWPHEAPCACWGGR